MVAVQTAGRSRSLTFDPTVALFGTVAFTGAALLFLIEPVVAKMALPRLGGSPAVWNTSLMFFQIVLLVGYGYAHLSTQRLGLRAQVTVHAVALAAPLLVLPIALPHWSPPGASAPIPWLLGLLVVTVGLPFFVVSTASPLTQRWFSARGHRLSADPYFLYAAGNAGSLLGLLSYPFLIEPRYTLAEQASLWSKGYVIFALLTAVAGFSLVRHEGRVRSRGADTRSTTLTAHPGVRSATTMIAETTAAAEAPKWPLRARWIFFAFIPSSLMMGVTSYLTTDIASLPLLWMLPLSVYLVTFILAFSPRNPLPPAVANKLLFVTVIPFALTSVLIRRGPLLAIGLHLLALFVAAMLCHGRLNEERPNAKRLTEFFFFVSLGGVLGGAFNALIAPMIFDTVAEYPLAVFLVLCARPTAVKLRIRPRDAIIALASVGAVGVAMGSRPVLGIVAALAAGPFLIRHRARVLIATGCTILAWGVLLPRQYTVFSDRTFFGALKIEDSNGFRTLYSGITRHGLMRLATRDKPVPSAYYHRTGPIGQFFEAMHGDPRLDQVALVGLGVGSLAAYSEPGQHFTFYEIDPAVIRIARDPKYFTFMSTAPGRIDTVVGDARVNLEKERDASNGVVVLDAFSSDSIPTHLLTREAIQLYFSKLTDNGVLAVHISNRNLDIAPVLAAAARDLGLTGRMFRDFEITPEARAEGKAGSQWVVMARDAAALAKLEGHGDWKTLETRRQLRVWTDDYSNILSVLK